MSWMYNELCVRLKCILEEFTKNLARWRLPARLCGGIMGMFICALEPNRCEKNILFLWFTALLSLLPLLLCIYCPAFSTAAALSSREGGAGVHYGLTLPQVFCVLLRHASNLPEESAAKTIHPKLGRAYYFTACVMVTCTLARYSETISRKDSIQPLLSFIRQISMEVVCEC